MGSVESGNSFQEIVTTTIKWEKRDRIQVKRNSVTFCKEFNIAKDWFQVIGSGDHIMFIIT